MLMRFKFVLTTTLIALAAPIKLGATLEAAAPQSKTKEDKLAQVLDRQWQQYEKDLALQKKQKIRSQNILHFDPQQSDPHFSSLAYQQNFVAPTDEPHKAYARLFDPHFIYTHPAPLNQQELSIVIAQAFRFTNTAADKKNNNWLYKQALDIYLQNGIEYPEANKTYLLHYSEVPVHEANKTQGPYYGTTPLHVAILKKDAYALKKLLTLNTEQYFNNGGTDEAFEPPVVAPANINIRDALGHTPLHLALRIWLADSTASSKPDNENSHDSNLHNSTTHNSAAHDLDSNDADPWLKNFIQPLLQAGAYPISQNTRGETILHNMVQLVTEQDSMQGQDFATLNPQVISRFKWFEENVLPFAALYLINETDFRGHTPLVKLALSWSTSDATPQQQLQIFKAFSTFGASLSATDEYGRDIRDLLAAAYNTHYDQLGKYYLLEDNALTQYFEHLQPDQHKQAVFSAQEKDFLQAAYNNDIVALKISLKEAEKHLQATEHASGLGDYAVFQALELMAQNNWSAALFTLLRGLKKILPGPHYFYTQASAAFNMSIKAGSIDVVNVLIHLFQVSISPRHLELAIRHNQAQLAHAFLKRWIDNKGPKNFIDLSPTCFRHTDLRDIHVPEELQTQLNQQLKSSLVPAMQTQNLELINFVLHFSPASLQSHSYYYDIPYHENVDKKDNVFHVALSMQPPNLELLDTLLYHYRKTDQPAGLQEVLNEKNHRDETLWQQLAYQASTQPEYIQQYKHIFRRLVAELKRQHTHLQKTQQQQTPLPKAKQKKISLQKNNLQNTKHQTVTLSELGVTNSSQFLEIFDASWGKQATRFQASGHDQSRKKIKAKLKGQAQEQSQAQSQDQGQDQSQEAAPASNQLDRFMFTKRNKEKHKQLWQSLFDSYESCTGLLSKQS